MNKSFFTKRLEEKIEERSMNLPQEFIDIIDLPFDRFTEEDQIFFESPGKILIAQGALPGLALFIQERFQLSPVQPDDRIIVFDQVQDTVRLLIKARGIECGDDF